MDKYLIYYQLLDHWLEAKHYGHSAEEYFCDLGYKSIAIYGMGDMAKRLMEDLENTNIDVKYGIDRDVACSTAAIIDTFSMEDEFPDTDVIVVTPVTGYEEIAEKLRKKIKCPIVSMEEVIWSI